MTPCRGSAEAGGGEALGVGGRPGALQWVVVLVVGVLVVTIVLGLNLISRLGDGQKVLDAARPAFAAQRVAGDRAGVNFVSSIAQTVTSGWNDVPGTAGLTRFNGTPVKTVPDVRSYLSSDVIPVLESQQGHYANLASTSMIDFIGPLVLLVGMLVIVWGLVMLLLAWLAEPRTRRPPKVSPASAGLV